MRRSTTLFARIQLTVAVALLLAMLPCAADDAGRTDGMLSEAELRAQGFVSIFDGRSLSGWAVQPWHAGHWVARDGVIDYDGEAKAEKSRDNSLWTQDEYGDLRLYVEWRLPSEPTLKPHPIVLFNGDFLRDESGKRITRPRLDAGDSGILLRGTHRCQANIWSQELGSGEVNGYRTDQSLPQEVRRACIPIANADKPAGEWNTFVITLHGNQMTVELNGQKVIEAVPLPDLPERGPIGLQHHGDPVQFRKLWVRKLDGDGEAD